MFQNPDSKLKFDTSPNCKCIFSILCILCVFRVSICTKQGSCSRHWLMLLPATASNITSMLTTPSYVLPGTPTTHPTDWPFSPSVPPTSGSGTCRTDSSSIQTNRKHLSSAPPHMPPTVDGSCNHTCV